MFYYFDPTMLLIIPGLILALWAQARVKSAYAKYAKVYVRSGMTGAQAARRLLDSQGLADIPIQRVAGELSDNYDPQNKVLNLSSGVYDSPSVAALGVAAHECGHAMQDKEGYAALGMRGAIVPVVNIGSNLSWQIFLAGLIFSWRPLLVAGIALFSLTVIFTLDAARRIQRQQPRHFRAGGRRVPGGRRIERGEKGALRRRHDLCGLRALRDFAASAAAAFVQPAQPGLT